jgi:hypothetical protein
MVADLEQQIQGDNNVQQRPKQSYRDIPAAQ